MAKNDPVTIKKYANRRLYNTGTSTYVTLEDLASMVKAGEDFVVYDAKTGDEITRSVLTQIIFEQENKDGPNLLPVAFLRQLIRYYGDNVQLLVPRFLEVSIDTFAKEQEKLRNQIHTALGGTPLAPFEEIARRNLELFEKAFATFLPALTTSARPAEPAEDPASAPAEQPSAPDEIDDLRKQMAEMQRKIEGLSKR